MSEIPFDDTPSVVVVDVEIFKSDLASWRTAFAAALYAEGQSDEKLGEALARSEDAARTALKPFASVLELIAEVLVHEGAHEFDADERWRLIEQMEFLAGDGGAMDDDTESDERP